MKMQQIQKAFTNVQRTIGNLWLLLSLGILLLVAALTVNGVSAAALRP